MRCSKEIHPLKFGVLIDNIMKKKNISNEKMAKDLNVDTNTFISYKHGEIPEIKKVVEILLLLGLEIMDVPMKTVLIKHDIDYKEFGNLILKRLSHFRSSRDDLAKSLNVNIEAVNAWIDEGKTPSRNDLLNLMEELEIRNKHLPLKHISF